MEAIANSPKMRTNNGPIPNTQAFLESAGVPRRVVHLRQSQEAYAQGDTATSVMYIQEGKVKLSVVNEVGKEAIVAILGPGDFFGEGCLAGQAVRMGTATALISTIVFVIQKSEMMRAIQSERKFPDRFMSYLLSRKIRTEEDLIDHLFNSSEKRLARALLLLTGYGKQEPPQTTIPKMSQEMLAEMVGTTRSRVNFFMNKFRKKGYIKCKGGLQIKPSLLNVLLHE
jgi:CRP/FNR family transcriptional regulator, cyclic AMP receptor protein